MSSIYSRYFRVTSGPLMEAAKQLEEDNKASRATLLAFAQEVGALGTYVQRDGSFGGVSFALPPDSTLWKRNRKDGLYWPSKKTKAAAELRKRVADLPAVRPLSSLLPHIQLHPYFPVLIHEGRGYSATIGGSVALGLLIVRVPWKDADPKEVEQYRHDNAQGTHFSMTMDHLLWTPPPDLVEIKKWEAERDIEQLSERIKQLQAQAATTTENTPAGTGRRITFECPDDREDRDDTANGRPLVARVLDVLATGPATRPELVAKLPGCTGNDISSAVGALIKRGRIAVSGTRHSGRNVVNVYALVEHEGGTR